MVSPLFYERFNKLYRKRLTECIRELLKSNLPYYHEIRPDLRIKFDEGVFYMRRSRDSARGGLRQGETSSVHDVYRLIRSHVWYWWDIYSSSFKKKEAVLKDLEALIRRTDTGRQYSSPCIKTAQRTIMF